MSKLFDSLKTAEKVATKLSAKTGVPHVVTETNGKFAVSEQTSAPVASEEPSAPEPETSVDNSDVLAASEPSVPDTVTIHAPKAKATNLYIITDVLGDKPRWFEKKRLISWQSDGESGFYLTMPRQQATGRKLQALIQNS